MPSFLVLSLSFPSQRQRKKSKNLLLIRDLFVFRPEGTPFEDGK